MVTWWFGAWWFGFLGSPYERDCYLEVPQNPKPPTQTTMSQARNQQFEQMGQLEAPKGRKGEYYWPLKTVAEHALESGANGLVGTVHGSRWRNH